MGLQEAPWANSTTCQHGAHRGCQPEQGECEVQGGCRGGGCDHSQDGSCGSERAEEYPIEGLNGAIGRGPGVASLQASTTSWLCDLVQVSGLQFSHLSLS